MPLVAWEIEDGAVTVEWRVGAPAFVAWDRLTDPDVLPQWLGTALEHEMREHGRLAVDHGEGYVCESVVEVFDPPNELAISWHFPDEHPTRVSFTFVDIGDAQCTLRLHHGSLAHLCDSYLAGWLTHLTFFDGAVVGAPLPKSSFWDLHATVARLLRQ